LKSFSYFKNIFSSIDGNAYIYSNISGTFKKPRYNFNLKIKNASFQPIGYDKDITINDAQIMLKQDKVFIKNIKGNLLGGSFEITGNPDDNNQIFNLSTNNAFLNLKANNLEYSLPEVADIEASLDLTLKGNIKNLKLYGSTKIIDGKFYKEINIVDSILNPLTKKTEAYEEGINLKTVPILKNISLDVNVINEGLVISNNLMSDVAVKANLTILGTLGAPIIVGEITAKDGTVSLLRNVFDLTNLGIKFNKADLLSSKLEFEAESILRDYDPISDEYTNRNVYLMITGKLNNPKVELTGEGLTKVQTLMLLLTGQSGLNTSGTVVNEDRGSKITNQVFSILLQNSLNKLTSDFTKQTDISIQTSINSSGGLAVSANKRIAERVVVTGVGEFENNILQKEISAEIIITDQLVIEILKAFEEGTTDLGLKYRLKLE
jgi:translocation and assembly module TamB